MQFWRGKILVYLPAGDPREILPEKVGKLYVSTGSKYSDCRHRHDLTCRSCREHHSRVDALTRNPEMFSSLLRSGSSMDQLLAIRAYSKMVGRRR